MQEALIVRDGIGEARLVFIEKAELAVGERVVGLIVNHAQKELFSGGLILRERGAALGRGSELLLLLLLRKLENLLALAVCAFVGELIGSGLGSFCAELAIGLTEQHFVAGFIGKGVDEAPGARDGGAGPAVLNVDQDVECDNRREGCQVVVFQSSFTAHRLMRIDPSTGRGLALFEPRMVMVEGGARLVFEGAVAIEQLECGSHGAWIVTGCGHCHDAVAIGLLFHLARVSVDRFDENELAGDGGACDRQCRAAGSDGACSLEDFAQDGLFARATVFKICVALVDVRGFVAEDRGQLRLILEQGDEAHGDVNRSVGLGESVGCGIVEDHEAPGDMLRRWAIADYALTHRVDIRLNAGIVKDDSLLFVVAVHGVVEHSQVDLGELKLRSGGLLGAGEGRRDGNGQRAHERQHAGKRISFGHEHRSLRERLLRALWAR